MATVEQILNTEIPAPTFVFQPSRASPLKSGMTFNRVDQGNPDPTGLTLDPRVSQFVTKSANTPRIHGDDAGLLFDLQRTNHVLWSSDFARWGINGGASLGSAANNLIDHPDAAAYALDSTGNVLDGFRHPSGTFSQGFETAVCYLENKNGGAPRLKIRNNDTGSVIAWGQTDWAAPEDPTNFNTSGLLSKGGDPNPDFFVDVLPFTGPNGGEVMRMEIRYDTSGQGSSDQRDIRIDVDRSTSGGGFYAHHGQVENVVGASPTPIVTNGSATTQGCDEAIIDVGKDIPGDRLTCIFEGRMMANGFTTSTMVNLVDGSGGGVLVHSGGRQYEPIQIGVFDDGGKHVGTVEPRTTFRFAVSVNSSTIRMGLNGTTQDRPHSGSLLGYDKIRFGHGVFKVHSCSIHPWFATLDELAAITS